MADSEVEASPVSGTLVRDEKKHDNYLTVGKIIYFLKKPITLFIDNIIEAFHRSLQGKLQKDGKCRSPDDCNKKSKREDLCESCKCWFDKLRDSHKRKGNPWWHKNCNCARWSDDHWEVAKFFMSTLGDNLDTVKDAQTTDISPLLNVIDCLIDKAFSDKIVHIANEFRSKVRNHYAHSPQQEMSDEKRKESFFIATKFLESLVEVFPHQANRACLKELQGLQSQVHAYEVTTSCLPDKSPDFTDRDNEIEEVVSLLLDKGTAVVALYGGPGVGKSAIAVEVSHQLHNDKNIPVIFCQLTAASTVDEMVVSLCCDVGVAQEEKAKSSFLLWLKRIRKQVIFIMDHIDKLLEPDLKTSFFDFVLLMRKNSNHHCQIITTSRMVYEIPELTAKVQINDMKDESCIALLRKKCTRDEYGNFLQNLAGLCGNIPLAMCIAVARVDDFEKPDDLLQILRIDPLDTLRCPDRDQYVDRAINMSYEMLNDEEKGIFDRLAVFDGSFDDTAANAVNDIHEKSSDMKGILRNLVSRSLIVQPIKHKPRYSIHLLIKHFLKKQLERKGTKTQAQVLMVGYYLELAHNLTIQSYSKDGYKAKRDALKMEAHHIQNVLKICLQQNDMTTDINACITNSEVYTASARLFSIFIRTVIPGSIVDKFLELCAKLAKERKDYATKIELDFALICVDKLSNMMEEIEREFCEHHDALKENSSLCAHYHYQSGRSEMKKSQTCKPREAKIDILANARQQLNECLDILKSPETPVEIADKILSLLQMGTIWKKIAAEEHSRGDIHACDESNRKTLKYYENATQLSKEYLGDHELTSTCYKYLGDFFLFLRNNKKAEEMYTNALEMRENLGIATSEKHVYILINLGKCLTYVNRAEESAILLEGALDAAKKLADSDQLNHCQAKACASLAIACDKLEWYSKSAMEYATIALQFPQIDKAIMKYELNKLKAIQSREPVKFP